MMAVTEMIKIALSTVNTANSCAQLFSNFLQGCDKHALSLLRLNFGTAGCRAVRTWRTDSDGC